MRSRDVLRALGNGLVATGLLCFGYVVIFVLFAVTVHTLGPLWGRVSGLAFLVLVISIYGYIRGYR